MDVDYVRLHFKTVKKNLNGDAIDDQFYSIQLEKLSYEEEEKILLRVENISAIVRGQQNFCDQMY